MQYSDVFLPETIKLFENFDTKLEKSENINESKRVRLIKLSVKKALCYIQIGDIEQF